MPNWDGTSRKRDKKNFSYQVQFLPDLGWSIPKNIQKKYEDN